MSFRKIKKTPDSIKALEASVAVLKAKTDKSSRVYLQMKNPKPSSP